MNEKVYREIRSRCHFIHSKMSTDYEYCQEFWHLGRFLYVVTFKVNTCRNRLLYIRGYIGVKFTDLI